MSIEFIKRIVLIVIGLIIALVIVEFLLRFLGWGFLYLQQKKNDELAPSMDIQLDQSSGIQLKQPEERVFTILCIGESTTALGGGNSWPDQLQRVLNNIQNEYVFNVVNKGIPNITTNDLSTKLQEFLSSYSPNLVLAMVGINDNCDRHSDYCVDSAGFGLSPGVTPSSEGQWIVLFNHLRIYGLIEWISDGITARVSEKKEDMSTSKLLGDGSAEGNGVVYNLINPNVSQLHPQTIRNLNNMVNLTTDQGIDFIFAQYALRKTDVLRNIIEKDVFYISNYDIFSDLLKKYSYDDLFYDNFAKDFGHATAFGNRVIADNVARQLLVFLESPE